MAADTVMIMKGLAEAEKVIRDHVPERYIGYARQACVDAIEYLKSHKEVHLGQVPAEQVEQMCDNCWLRREKEARDMEGWL